MVNFVAGFRIANDIIKIPGLERPCSDIRDTSLRFYRSLLLLLLLVLLLLLRLPLLRLLPSMLGMVALLRRSTLAICNGIFVTYFLENL